MTGRPVFDPFAALAAAKAKRAPQEARKTFAELSQTQNGQETLNHQGVGEKFAAFATFAGPSNAHADQSHGPDIRKKERFSLSFQRLTMGERAPGGPSAAKANADASGAPAKAAILRKKTTSHCSGTENGSLSAAKVSQDAPPRIAPSGNRPSAPAKVFALDFEERAAFLEYECGLSREDAETQARAECEPPAAELARGPAAIPQAAGLALWRAGIALLSPHRAPCPGYRGDEWSRVHRRALAFLETYGAQAEALGWTAPRLFGVHPVAGIVRVDACGALVLPAGGDVRALTATEIRFGHLTHREKPGQPSGVPVWEIEQ